MTAVSDLCAAAHQRARAISAWTNSRVRIIRKSLLGRALFVAQLLLVTAAPAMAQNCDPNYSPCVPVARDVDCAGGSGNGPAYVEGPVTVIGSDIYDLDRDGDGVGCE
jgi:hypothetical protein